METDQDRLERLTRKATEFARGRAMELEGKVASIRQKIEDLQDSRHEVERAPKTKEETLSYCKKTLQERREVEFIQGLLLPHLTTVREKNMEFLNPAALRVYLLSDANLFRWASQWIDDGVLEKAVALLPEGGFSERDRVKKISEINSKISGLEKEIEALLK